MEKVLNYINEERAALFARFAPRLFAKPIIRARLNHNAQPATQIVSALHCRHRLDHAQHGILNNIKAKRFIPTGGVAGLGVHRVEPLTVERSERLGVSRGDRLCE